MSNYSWIILDFLIGALNIVIVINAIISNTFGWINLLNILAAILLTIAGIMLIRELSSK